MLYCRMQHVCKLNVSLYKAWNTVSNADCILQEEKSTLTIVSLVIIELKSFFVQRYFVLFVEPLSLPPESK